MSLRCAASVLIPALFCSLALPARAMAQAPAAAAARSTERVVVIDMQGMITNCNEGQRDLGALAKKFEPRRMELQKLSAELDGLKKQLSEQGATMQPGARDALSRSIDAKTKTLQRSVEDFQNESQQQQNEIAQRILQKLAPVLKKYVDDHGYALVLDGSVAWPQGPVVMVSPTIDITKAVIEAYNAQSGVPAPAKNPN